MRRAREALGGQGWASVEAGARGKRVPTFVRGTLRLTGCPWGECVSQGGYVLSG